MKDGKRGKWRHTLLLGNVFEINIRQHLPDCFSDGGVIRSTGATEIEHAANGPRHSRVERTARLTARAEQVVGALQWHAKPARVTCVILEVAQVAHGHVSLLRTAEGRVSKRRHAALVVWRRRLGWRHVRSSTRAVETGQHR